MLIYVSPSNASMSHRLVIGRPTLKHDLRRVNFYDSLGVVNAAPLNLAGLEILSAAARCHLQTKQRFLFSLLFFLNCAALMSRRSELAHDRFVLHL